MKLHKAIDFCTPITDDCFLNTWVQLEVLRYIKVKSSNQNYLTEFIIDLSISEKANF